MSTFEYEVIGLNFQSILQNGDTVTPQWTFCLNDRIHALECGRFFASDSSPQGEVSVALPRRILWFTHDGKLIRELKLEHAVLSFCNVQPAVFNTYGKHPVIVSQLVLLKNA